MSARDELAVIIVNTYEPGFPEDTKSVRLRHVLLSQYAEVADAILSSDWLAQHDREVAAKVWDEALDAVGDQWVDGGPIRNRYRDPAPTLERHDTSCALLVRHAPCDCPRGQG